MRFLKVKFSVLILLIMTLATLLGCSTLDASNFNDGYYTTIVNESFDNVYKASLEALKNGQTFDLKGSPYDIKINEKKINKAVIAAESDSDPADFVEIAIQKKSEDKTELSIKYGKNGNTIRSSAFIPFIQENIKHH
ncbi:lipoprotein [Francisella halioticida]|uniref:DUF3568 family protein n=1 Tax=Francisella halioticida TaxID=549298 RepID=UPI001AF04175|nr:DUF3568 family protein [Francisella halioticida]BCD90847.1 lipoprotein [Francisella halioticida]